MAWNPESLVCSIEQVSQGSLGSVRTESRPGECLGYCQQPIKGIALPHCPSILRLALEGTTFIIMSKTRG